jgi:plasmid rolling circle replication initiator protein Rep
MEHTTQPPVDQDLEKHLDKLLIDIHPVTGQLQPWQRKKKETETMAHSHHRIGQVDPGFDNRASRLMECGKYLEFRRFTNGDRTLSRANFCKYRLCPMCSWRRSLKIFGQASQVMDVAKEQGLRFVFVTLTVKNCKGSMLSRTLDQLYKSVTRLHRMKEIKGAVQGWMRAYEITHNTDRLDKSFDTYHPHVHEIWAVRPSYFKKGYVTQAKLTESWQKATRLDYAPITHIAAVNEAKKGHIREVAKYSVKPGDILVDDHDLTDRAVYALDHALYRRRLVAWGGVLKKIKAELGLEDAENGDLVNVDGQEINKELDYILERYYWHAGFRIHMKSSK